MQMSTFRPAFTGFDHALVIYDVTQMLYLGQVPDNQHVIKVRRSWSKRWQSVSKFQSKVSLNSTTSTVAVTVFNNCSLVVKLELTLRGGHLESHRAL